MKWNKLWKTLNRDHKAAWKTWARSNPVRLENGHVRRVCGEKAFTIVLNNRAIAGEAANPTIVPATVAWLMNVLSTQDAGPFTIGEGSMHLRGIADVPTPSTWFVWGTAPTLAAETLPLRSLRFVTCVTLPYLTTETLTNNFAPEYRRVHGSFNGPGVNGAWADDHYVWFRVQQYANGQLGPEMVLKGKIQVDL